MVNMEMRTCPVCQSFYVPIRANQIYCTRWCYENKPFINDDSDEEQKPEPIEHILTGTGKTVGEKQQYGLSAPDIRRIKI